MSSSLSTALPQVQDDVDVLSVAQLLLRNPHQPVLVWREIRQQDARLHEEVEVRRIGDRGEAAVAGRLFRRGRPGPGAGVVGVVVAGRRLLLAGVGLTNCPGVQQ